MPNPTQTIFTTLNINLEFQQFEKNKVLQQQLKIKEKHILPASVIEFDTSDCCGSICYHQISHLLSVIILQFKTYNDGIRICFNSQNSQSKPIACIETESRRKDKDSKWISTYNQFTILPTTHAQIIVLGFNKNFQDLGVMPNQNMAFTYNAFRYFNQIFELNQNHLLYKITQQSLIYALVNQVIKTVKTFEQEKAKVSENDLKSIMLLEKYEVKKDDFSHDSYSIEEWSSMASMCPTKFKKIFKLLFGEPPHQYFLNYKMDLAQRLLLSKKFTISQIANRVGYQSIGRFSSAFMAKFGILPSKI
ncbi:MAG: AraC family transcriptional regulator [Spirosomaceae bacterium]|nr:AraC family transcriptional regulator [Spirosomataceae bacterium]